MILPPPTGEQDAALELWVKGTSVTVSAAAGSGKSTLLLHAVRRAPRHSQVAILSYNRPLATEMTIKLETLKSHGCTLEGVSAQAFTFHGLCSHLFALTPDDTTMEDVLDAVDRGELSMSSPFCPTHVCIDEVQDMRQLHHRLLCAVLPKSCVYMLVGDANQLLYDFENPPASTVFMETPWEFFTATDWATARLSTSFRLTTPVAAFVNAVSKQSDMPTLEAGNIVTEPPVTSIISCTVWQWTQKLVPLIMDALRQAKCPSEIGIIARSVRASQPLVTLVNALAAANLPLYVHSCDGSDPRVRHNKICVCTWHASKGLQWPYTFVLGVDSSSEPRPLHVALTRSQSVLVVVNDSSRPHIGILRATRTVDCTVDTVTSDLAGRLDSLRAAPVWERSMAPREVSNFAPRGQIAHQLHTMILDVGGRSPGTTTQPSEQVVQVRTGWEDVTDIFVDAVMIATERYRSGHCSRVEEMLHPIRLARAVRLERLMMSNRQRAVDTRFRDSELLPHATLHALHTFVTASDEKSLVEDSCRAAVSASAFVGFHHRAARLIMATWWDDDLFRMSMTMVDETIEQSSVLDAVVSRPPSTQTEHPLYMRVHARSQRVVYRVTYGQRLTASERLLAVLPLALDDTLDVAVLLNIRTGECQRLVLSDRLAFLSGVHETV